MRKILNHSSEFYLDYLISGNLYHFYYIFIIILQRKLASNSWHSCKNVASSRFDINWAFCVLSWGIVKENNNSNLDGKFSKMELWYKSMALVRKYSISIVDFSQLKVITQNGIFIIKVVSRHIYLSL